MPNRQRIAIHIILHLKTATAESGLHWIEGTGGGARRSVVEFPSVRQVLLDVLSAEEAACTLAPLRLALASTDGARCTGQGACLVAAFLSSPLQFVDLDDTTVIGAEMSRATTARSRGQASHDDEEGSRRICLVVYEAVQFRVSISGQLWTPYHAGRAEAPPLFAPSIHVSIPPHQSFSTLLDETLRLQ